MPRGAASRGSPSPRRPSRAGVCGRGGTGELGQVCPWVSWGLSGAVCRPGADRPSLQAFGLPSSSSVPSRGDADRSCDDREARAASLSPGSFLPHWHMTVLAAEFTDAPAHWVTDSGQNRTGLLPAQEEPLPPGRLPFGWRTLILLTVHFPETRALGTGGPGPPCVRQPSGRAG